MERSGEAPADPLHWEMCDRIDVTVLQKITGTAEPNAHVSVAALLRASRK